MKKIKYLSKINRHLLIIIFIILISQTISGQQRKSSYIFSGTKRNVHYSGTLVQFLADNNNSVDTIRININTELTNIYNSKYLKVIKCSNFPMFIEFDKEKLIKGIYNTYFMAIISDSEYCLLNYKDKDVNQTLTNLLTKKNRKSENEFINLPHFSLLNLKNNKSILYYYEDKKFNYSQITKRINNSNYESYIRDNNSKAQYFVDYIYGLYKINYEWNRVNNFVIKLTQDK